MVDEIYNQIKTPKTIDEIHQRLNEIGIEWNKSQIELFLEMDKNIVGNGQKWQAEGENKNDVILQVIDKVLGSKPIVPIKKILDIIDADYSDIQTDAKQILNIALDSNQFISTNGKTLKRKNQQ
jgi:hypothetical protein